MMEVFWNDLARNAADLDSPLNRAHPVDGEGVASKTYPANEMDAVFSRRGGLV